MFVRSYLAGSMGLVLLLGTLADVHGDTLFTDDFDAGASALWGNENGSWSASAGVYDAAVPDNFPNAHSSLPFDLQDFEISLDINSQEDGGIWLRSSEAPGTSVGRKGVLLVTGGFWSAERGLYWHIVETGQGYGTYLNLTPNLFAPGDDIHLRVTVIGDTYSAFLNGETIPATMLTTNAFSAGEVALYDYSQQTFDNVVLRGVPEPSTFFLLSLGAAGLFACARRRRRRAA